MAFKFAFNQNKVIALKTVGTFLDARKRACSMFEANIDMGHGGQEQVASEEEKRAKVLNEKGFWEGGIIRNTHGKVGSLASFQL